MFPLTDHPLSRQSRSHRHDRTSTIFSKPERQNHNPLEIDILVSVAEGGQTHGWSSIDFWIEKTGSHDLRFFQFWYIKSRMSVCRRREIQVARGYLYASRTLKRRWNEVPRDELDFENESGACMREDERDGTARMICQSATGIFLLSLHSSSQTYGKMLLSLHVPQFH
jgi:hypothetical protein